MPFPAETKTIKKKFKIQIGVLDKATNKHFTKTIYFG